MLFDALVKSVMMYGAEIQGLERREEIERVQERYLRWCLGVNYNTPGYCIRWETGIWSMFIGASNEAMKFEAKMARYKEGSKEKNAGKNEQKQED